MCVSGGRTFQTEEINVKSLKWEEEETQEVGGRGPTWLKWDEQG